MTILITFKPSNEPMRFMRFSGCTAEQARGWAAEHFAIVGCEEAYLHVYDASGHEVANEHYDKNEGWKPY